MNEKILFLISVMSLVACHQTEDNVKEFGEEDFFLDEGVMVENEMGYESNLANDKLYLPFKLEHKFEDYNCSIYSGELAEPNFENNPYAKDSVYVEFITQGCLKRGINFAGHYTSIERSCGAFCSHLFIVNRITGIIENFELPENDGGSYGYEYNPNSQLLITNSEMFVDSAHEFIVRFPANTVPKCYLLNGDAFLELESHQLEP